MKKKIRIAYYPYQLTRKFHLVHAEIWRDLVFLWLEYKPMRQIFKFTIDY